MTAVTDKRAIRAPKTLSFGLNHLLRIKNDQLAFYVEMRTEHGDAVPLRLGPYRSWLLFHPADIERVLTSEWQSFIRFEKLTKVVAQWTGENMLLAEGAEWRDRRRKVLPAFKTQRLPDYGDKAAAHARLLSETLTKRANALGNVEFDTDAVMARLTLDIAASTFFARSPPENGDEIEIAIQILSDTAFRESTAPLVLPDWLPLPEKRRKQWAMDVMDRYICDIVDARLGRESGDKGDLLSILIDQHAGDRIAIRNDAMSLLIAGHETSGALLSWTAHCLVNAPDWLDRLRAELRQVLGGRLPAAGDLGQMPILRAIVDEVLRLYPPAYALFLRRATSDVSMDGFTIRKGDLVQIAPYALHRDPRWFANPDGFDPHRFLREPDWPRYAYLPFGNGPRVCIGQHFGMMEVCLVIATLFQDWVPSAEQAPVKPEPRFSLRPRGGLPMVWQRVNGDKSR